MNSGLYIKDEQAFLFLIRSNNTEHASKCPIIFKCLRPNLAIHSSKEFGPTFGFGHDVCIIDKCDQQYIFDENEEHEEQMSYCYESSMKTYIAKGDILCGGNSGPKKNDRTKFFRVVEYEVLLLSETE